jgi:hypothetical protein
LAADEYFLRSVILINANAWQTSVGEPVLGGPSALALNFQPALHLRSLSPILALPMSHLDPRMPALSPTGGKPEIAAIMNQEH